MQSVGTTFPYILEQIARCSDGHVHEFSFLSNESLCCRLCNASWLISSNRDNSFCLIGGHHHFHGNQGQLSFYCCQCDYQIQFIETNEVKMKALKVIQDFSDKEAVKVCLDTIILYLNNVKNGKNQSIRMSNVNFQKKVAALNGGVDLLKEAGFYEIEGHLIPPDIKVQLGKINSVMEQIENFQKKKEIKQDFIGIERLASIFGSSESYSAPTASSYRSLGLFFQLSDAEILHFFSLLRKEKPSESIYYVSKLKEIADERGSDYLKSQLLQLQRENVFTASEVQKAYKALDCNLGSSDQQIYDSFLLGNSANIESLRIIALHRKSQSLSSKLGLKFTHFNHPEI